mmetsp:Transcript_66427/g.149933  ORF Transcript_66427/g.149933 Transcript_66427/m.149933 type:complete len:265 (-) Transcript_66427:77-871(-)
MKRATSASSHVSCETSARGFRSLLSVLPDVTRVRSRLPLLLVKKTLSASLDRIRASIFAPGLIARASAGKPSSISSTCRNPSSSRPTSTKTAFPRSQPCTSPVTLCPGSTLLTLRAPGSFMERNKRFESDWTALTRTFTVDPMLASSAKFPANSVRASSPATGSPPCGGVTASTASRKFMRITLASSLVSEATPSKGVPSELRNTLLGLSRLPERNVSQRSVSFFARTLAVTLVPFLMPPSLGNPASWTSDTARKPSTLAPMSM